MEWVLWIFHFSENDVDPPNDPGQIYVVPQYMKKMGTIVLDSVFVLVKKLNICSM